MSLQFNGSPDRLEFGTSSLFDAGSGDFTIMGWGMMNDTTQSALWGKGSNGAGGFRYKLEYDGGASNFLKFEIDDNGGNGKLEVITTTALNDGLWHHIVGVRDNAAALIRVYVDGVQEATASMIGGSYGSLNSSLSAIMGAFHNASGGFEEFLDGRVDDARLYVGRALSADEILNIYTARGRDGIVQDLSVRWILNEQPAGTPVTTAGDIKDVGPNGLNGVTVNSSPTWEPSELNFKRRFMRA